MSRLIVNEIEKYDASQLTISSPITVTGGITGTLSTAAQTNITSVGTLSSLAVSGNAAFDTNTLFVDAANNRVGVGTASPSANLEASSSFRVSEGGFQRYFDVTESTVKLYGGVDPSIKFGDYNTGADHVATIGFENDYFGRGAIRFVVKEQGGGTASEAARFLSSGGLTFNGDTSSANALDDYEEGTWNPTVADASSGGNLATLSAGSYGAYTKIGNVVYFRFSVILSSKGSMSSGNDLWVRGFPYTSVPISGNWYNPSAVIIRNTTFSGYVQFNQVANSTVGYFRYNESGGTGGNILVSQTTDSSAMQVSGFYSIS
jgi:hypothetical protein